MKEEIETGTVIGLASEGQGIIRSEGLVTFVPFTAPGDTIRYRITQQKKNFALGVLEEVMHPSVQRAKPLCPYFGTCGGCQLQHLNYDSQLKWKRQWIEDALKRIAGLDNITVPDVVPAHAQWGYRRRITLHLKPHMDTYQAGYTATDNRTLVPVTQCVIFADAKDPIIATIQTMASKLKAAGKEEARVTILKSSDNYYIIQFHFKTLPENISEVCSEYLKASPNISGIVASSARKTVSFGQLKNSLEIDGLHFDFSPKAFIQNHPEQSLNIYKSIEAKALKLKPKNALDLYSGIGISSLLLARHGTKVTGIESNPEAVHLATTNANKNKLSNASFVAADVAAVLDTCLMKNLIDFAIVNPPREGLAPAVVQSLCAQPVPTLLYVSCMPSTLARDLKLLCQNHYSISSIEAFDMFPQTVHVETLVTLKAKV